MSIEALVLVPFEPASAALLDPKFRQTQGAALSLPMAAASAELEAYVGRPLNFWDPAERPIFGGEAMPFPSHRSLTAMVLATSLEHAGLNWRAIDPGVIELRDWRRQLQAARSHQPKTIALSTTFIMTAPWLRTFCTMIRQALPDALLLVGGYYYATNAMQFLNLDADILCVGEGEKRLPQLIACIRDRGDPSDIPGLYIRRAGEIRHTGHVEPLTIAELPPVDWRLASRIEPPIDLSREAIEFEVETQRGCIFKCEFCTYRTLARPGALTPARAAQIIKDTGISPHGYLAMADSTASYPHQRWEEVCSLLAAEGGSPHPIWAFARVSDITEPRARLMAAAGVRHVFVGQESGNQLILNSMKKGTRVIHVRPAIDALRAHGIGATFSFMHAFPGESEATIADTRGLIAQLNRPQWDHPTVFAYVLYPFIRMDFAAISRKEDLASVEHYLGYDAAPIPPQRACEEVLATVVAVSRMPSAPVFAFLFESGPPTNGMAIFCSPYRNEIFRWLKAVERGVAIFLERNLDGFSKAGGELPAIRDHILRHAPVLSQMAVRRYSMRARINRALMLQLHREWEAEARSGAGLVTRAAVALELARASGSIRFAAHAWRNGSIAEAPLASGLRTRDLADELVTRAIAGARLRSRASQSGSA